MHNSEKLFFLENQYSGGVYVFSLVLSFTPIMTKLCTVKHDIQSDGAS